MARYVRYRTEFWPVCEVNLTPAIHKCGTEQTLRVGPVHTSCMGYTSAKTEIIDVALPPQSVFDTMEAERLTACAERASHDPTNSIEISRLLRNAARILYCALVETAQRARLRLASVIALDRVSFMLRSVKKPADVAAALIDSVATVTLLANANESEDPIEHRRTKAINTAALALAQNRRAQPQLAAPAVSIAGSMAPIAAMAARDATESTPPVR